MCKIGTNTSGIDKSIFQGKEIGTFETEVKARAKAKEHEGSEIVYRDEDNKWHVAELTQEGLLWGQNDVSMADVCDIVLDEKHFKDSKVKDVSISFVEGNNFEFISSRPVNKSEYDWAKDLQGKVQNGYKPSDLEKRKYDQINKRSLEPGIEGGLLPKLDAPSSSAVTQEEKFWVSRIDYRIRNGVPGKDGKNVKFTPDKNEQARYDEIKSRMK